MKLDPKDWKTYPNMRRHSRYMAWEINNMGFTKICEVGVWRGEFMKNVLRVSPNITEYWAIDPYTLIPNPETYREQNQAVMPQVQWDNLYIKVIKQVRNDLRAKIIRSTSLDVVKIIPDGYFDLVFLDGDHRYEACLQDIKAWWPKVRKGGWISGHDHNKKSPGVKRAVAEMFPPEDSCRLHAWCWRYVV